MHKNILQKAKRGMTVPKSAKREKKVTKKLSLLTILAIFFKHIQQQKIVAVTQSDKLFFSLLE